MSMIAKVNQRNQVELPEQVLQALGRPSSFDVTVEDGRLVLTPERSVSSDDVIEKLGRLDLQSADVAEAIAWARRQR